MSSVSSPPEPISGGGFRHHPAGAPMHGHAREGVSSPLHPHQELAMREVLVVIGAGSIGQAIARVVFPEGRVRPQLFG